MYSRLPPEPQRKEPQVDLFPDVQEGDSKPGLANYLDEFLSAIKVFGYLERPVFHELTRTMQTRKLIAGETLMLEEEKGFCLVVDGLVQIFVKSMRDGKSDTDEELHHLGAESSDEEHHIDGKQGYQLLTEVKNGASMSSLFSILSLFTEDIQLRENESSGSSSSSIALRAARVPNSIPTSPRGVMDSPSLGFQDHSDDTSNMITNGELPSVPPLHLGESRTPPSGDQHHQQHHESRKHSSRKRRKSVHPDIVARAMVDAC